MRPRSPKRSLTLLLAALLYPAAACDEVTVNPGDATLTRPFADRRDAAGRGEIQLIAVNGEIEVSAAAGESVDIAAVLRVENCSRARAESIMDDVEVRVTTTASEIVVQTIQPDDPSPCTVAVDYQLAVPARLFARVIAVNGPIDVAGVAGGLSLIHVNGSVTLDVQGPTRAHLSNGSIEARAAIQGNERIELRTVNGSIDLAIPTTTDAELAAGVVNGAITVTNLTLTDRVATPTSLTGTLGTGTGTIVLHTTNGAIAVVGT